MKTPIREPEFTEPERYELHEGSFYHFEISRREFVQVLGAGVVLSVAVPSLFAQRTAENRPTNLAQRLHSRIEGQRERVILLDVSGELQRRGAWTRL